MLTSVTLKVHDNAEPAHPPSEVRWSVLNRVCFVVGYGWAVLTTVFFAVAYGFAQLVTRDHNVFRFWASGWGGSLLLGFGVRVDVEMRTTLDSKQPYVFASNHQNLLDIPILASTLPHPFGFVAKLELESVPFLGTALKLSPSVFVGGKDARRSLESLRRAGQQIRDGRSVIIFPEGQRTFRRDMVSFKKSAFALASEAGVPLVPITIVDAYRLMNESVLASRPGRVRVVVHPPVQVSGATGADLAPVMQRVRSIIESELPRKQTPAPCRKV
jgi:1-acyl-sn-glycerol-3-phosphate acyltransferase